MRILDLFRARANSGRHTQAGQIKRLQQDVARVTAERDEARGRSDHHLNLLRGSNAEVHRLLQVLGQDAGLAAVRQPAPADRPDFQPEPADPPIPAEGGHLLTELVEPDPEATQSLGVSALRAAAQMDAGDTQQLPAVPPVTRIAPPPMRVTWGVKQAQPELAEWALGTAPPPPSAGATSVPVGLGDRVSVKVRTALEEAS